MFNTNRKNSNAEPDIRPQWNSVIGLEFRPFGQNNPIKDFACNISLKHCQTLRFIEISRVFTKIKVQLNIYPFN